MRLVRRGDGVQAQTSLERPALLVIGPGSFLAAIFVVLLVLVLLVLATLVLPFLLLLAFVLLFFRIQLLPIFVLCFVLVFALLLRHVILIVLLPLLFLVSLLALLFFAFVVHLLIFATAAVRATAGFAAWLLFCNFALPLSVLQIDFATRKPVKAESKSTPSSCPSCFRLEEAWMAVWHLGTTAPS